MEPRFEKGYDEYKRMKRVLSSNWDDYANDKDKRNLISQKLMHNKKEKNRYINSTRTAMRKNFGRIIGRLTLERRKYMS